MRKLSIDLTACALAGLAALNSAAALAQDTRWFRVELLAFANQAATAPVGAAVAEQWDATPTLAYPVASRFLIDPARAARNKSEFPGDSLIDEYGRQIISMGIGSRDTGGPTAGDFPPAATAGAGPATAAQTQSGPEPKPLTPVYSEPMPSAAPQALPRPFVILPASYREFRGKAALMERAGRYSILFHEAWVQPVPPEANSLPIVLDHSGDNQQWPRLQGSIKIFLSRYLQVETNLWLNTQGEYLPGTWRMPPPPFGPQSLVVEEEEEIDLAAEIARMPDGTALETEAATATMAVENVDAMASDMVAGQADGNPLAGELPDGEVVLKPAGPLYPFRHAVLLEQQRRMRSNEVHYIDHPLIGLVIKFTPATAEELAAIAEFQEESLGDNQAL